MGYGAAHIERRLQWGRKNIGSAYMRASHQFPERQMAMTTSRRVLALVILTTCSTQSFAQVVWTVGIGKTSCGVAMQNIQKKGSAWEAHYMTWIGGFISGYNLAVADETQSNSRVGEGVPNARLIAMFKEKCGKYPQKPLPQAAFEIRAELAAFRQ
jgi:hypothetical protein